MTASWIAVALSPDIPPAVAIPVIAPWGELVVWRSASGRLSCFPERCPHRGMRLSQGFVRGEMISCIYHGWRFDTGSQCRKIPAHPELVPPAAIRVSRYPVVEQDGLVWVAASETEEAPPVIAMAGREGAGAAPLRSLVVEAGIDCVARAAGLDGRNDRADPAGLMGPVALPGLAAQLMLVLQDQGTATGLHALLGEGAPRGAATRIAASRALEAFRRQVEQAAGLGEVAA
jgi:nitrite reductase/ring-hydroxylating ferredoxin subunit